MRCMARKILKIIKYGSKNYISVCVCARERVGRQCVCVCNENIWETGGESVMDERVCVRDRGL